MQGSDPCSIIRRNSRGKIALETELDIVFTILYLIHVKNQYTERYITTDE